MTHYTSMFGPPGPQKIAIGILTGVAYDLVWNLTGRKRYSLPFAAAVSTAVSILLIYFLMVLIAYPRTDYLHSLLKYLVPLYAVLGFVGAMIGNWIYDRSLSRISVIQQLKA
jgi:ABC-type thiamin/hydroxymethylpyrimidine transport system permease subunit